MVNVNDNVQAIPGAAASPIPTNSPVSTSEIRDN